VDTDALLVSQPDTGEQALEITDMLVRSGALDVVVIDSVAALVPRAEIEGEMGDSHVGLQARLMSQALRKLTASINKSNTMVIFINQIRMKIGVMYGSPETTTGGNALKFYASVRLDIRRIGAIKERDEVVGNTTRVKVVKNKLAPPFKQVEFDIMYGEGVSKMGEILDLGVKAGIVEKSGAWFSYDSQRLGQGRENSKAFLKANPDIAGKIEECVARPGVGRIGHRAGTIQDAEAVRVEIRRVLDRDREDLERPHVDRLPLTHLTRLERGLVLHGPVRHDAHGVDPARRAVDRERVLALEGEAKRMQAEDEIRPVVGMQMADEDRGQLVRCAVLEQSRERARAGVDPDPSVILLDQVARACRSWGRVATTRAENCDPHS
jgi:hypothetical protein